MYVKTRMSKDPFTITADASITDILELMREKGLRRVPVVGPDKKTVIGIVTEGDIQKVSPSKASTLSVYEMNYLLGKTKVSSVMTKALITIRPEALLEDAAVLMRANKVGALIVVEDGDKLAGIITESDIFDAFLDLLGFRDTGTRMTIRALNAPGVLADVTAIFKSFDYNISHIAVYNGNAERCDVVIRFNAINTEEIEKALGAHGYEVLHVLRSA